jgi:hypothetical protein
VFRWKKTVFSTFGDVQRCFGGKDRCSAHWGLSNGVSVEKNEVQHFWGCPTVFRWKRNEVQHFWGVEKTKKSMFSTFGRGKIDVQCVGDFQGVVTLSVAKAKKSIFPIRGGRFLRGGWVEGMPMTPAQKVGWVARMTV